MKLGILQCDRIGDEFLSHGQYPERFAALLAPVYPQITFKVFDAEYYELPSDIDAADAYLITGSRYGVNDGFAWIAQLEDFVRKLHLSEKKLIGICFGHQLIAKALGGKVTRWPKGWAVGISSNQVIQYKPWMNPAQSEFNLLASHQDQVMELPVGAEILASSDFCPYYMLQIGSNILSIQGHPEFTKSFSEELMHYRRHLLGEEVFQKGIESLNGHKDDQLLAHWMVHFLKE